LFAEAQQLFESGKYEAVVKIFESIQVLSPDFVDKEGLLEKSKLKTLEIERSKKLEDLYRRAIFELDAGRLKEAKILFLQLQSEEKGFRDTEKLLERVDSLIVKEAERTLETQQAEKEKKQAAKIKLSQRLAMIPAFAKIAVGLIVLVGVVVGGYFLIPKDEPLSGRIIIWHSLGANVSSFEKVVRAFEEKNPDVDVEMIQFSRDDLRNEFKSSAVAGTGPDLVMYDDKWGPQWYLSGLITDVSSVRVSRIDKVARNQGNYKGVQIGLPYQLAGVLMFRNKSIIAEPASSFQDLKQKAQKATVGDIKGALLDPGTWYSLGHLYALGGALMTDEGNPAFNTAEGIAWLEMLKEFRKLGAEFYLNDDGDLFKQRRVGVIIEGTWSLEEFYNYLGDDLVVDPWPENMSGFVEAAMIYLSANCAEENLKAAQGFMAYLVSSEAQTLLYNSDPNFIPVNTSIKITDTLRQQVITAFKGGIPVSILPEFSVYFAPMDDAIQRVVNGWLNPTASLEYAEQMINADLAEMRGQ
jgi:maltose-binding protein MalE